MRLVHEESAGAIAVIELVDAMPMAALAVFQKLSVSASALARQLIVVRYPPALRSPLKTVVARRVRLCNSAVSFVIAAVGFQMSLVEPTRADASVSRLTTT